MRATACTNVARSGTPVIAMTNEQKIAEALKLDERALELLDAFDLATARQACERALALLIEVEGSDSPDVANVLLHLASIRDLQCEWKEAATLAQRSLAIMDRLRPSFTGREADQMRFEAILQSGYSLRQLEHFDAAEVLLKQALQFAEAAFHPLDQRLANVLNHLGMLYKYTGEFDLAEQLYLRARAILLETCGPESSEMASIYHNLGGLEHARERYELAEPLSRRGYDMRREILGDDHPSTAADAVALAGVLDGLGRFEESEPLYLHAYSIFEEIYGECHYELAVILNNLAHLKRRQGEHTESKRLFQRTLEMKQRLFRPDHPEVALTQAELLMVSSA